jgi:hypothetical protein
MTSTSSSGSDAGSRNVNISPLEGADGERYVQAVVSSADYERFRNALSQERGQTFTLQEQEAVALRVESGEQQVVSVHVPIAGGAGDSFYGAVLDADSAAVRNSLSGLFDRNAEGGVAAVVERDGTVLLDAVMAPEGNVLTGTLTTDGRTTELTGVAVSELSALVAPPVTTDLLGCVNDCLVDAGINQLLIGVIEAACGVACGVTVGAGCIACIAAVIGVASGTLLGCLRRC